MEAIKNILSSPQIANRLTPEKTNHIMKTTTPSNLNSRPLQPCRPGIPTGRRPLTPILALLFFLAALLPGAAQTTPVLFPVSSMFGGAAFNRPLTITPANSLVSDGQNLWAGSYTIVPASPTNPVLNLYPNTYLLTVAGVVKPVRFTVPASTNVLAVTTLLTAGPLFYFGTNGMAALNPGTNLTFVTNHDGSITVNASSPPAPSPAPDVFTNQTQWAPPNLMYASVYPIAAATMLNNEAGATLSLSNASVRVNIYPCENACDPQILLTGWGMNYQDPVQLPGVNWFVNATIEYPSNTFYPLFVNGNSNITVQSGATILTDPVIFLDLPKWSNAWVREWWWTTNGNQTFQVGYVPNTANGIGNLASGTTYMGEWFYGNVGASGVNPPAGSLNGNNSPNYTYGISPQVLGYATTNDSLGILGDSIAQAPNGAGWAIHRSYLSEGLYGSVPFINGGESGSTFESWKQNPQALSLMTRYCRTIICTLGVNDDGQSLPYLTNLVVPFWQALQRRGCRVVQTTITPHATSTNAFLTEAGQTPVNLISHTNFNAWLRTQNYVPVLDVATNVESVSNPGCWKLIGGTNTTVDGLHPETSIAVWTLATCVSNNLSLFK